uniref:Uncharacterized protein n=1 Tax=Glossina austeni TaxID=7395 RepID=A0A1A9VAK1_GLOAU
MKDLMNSIVEEKDSSAWGENILSYPSGVRNLHCLCLILSSFQMCSLSSKAIKGYFVMMMLFIYILMSTSVSIWRLNPYFILQIWLTYGANRKSKTAQTRNPKSWINMVWVLIKKQKE